MSSNPGYVPYWKMVAAQKNPKPPPPSSTSAASNGTAAKNHKKKTQKERIPSIADPPPSISTTEMNDVPLTEEVDSSNHLPPVPIVHPQPPETTQIAWGDEFEQWAQEEPVFSVDEPNPIAANPTEQPHKSLFRWNRCPNAGSRMCSGSPRSSMAE